MSEQSYFTAVLINLRVLRYAFITAFKNLMWPMLVIGTPAIFFGFKSEWYNQVGLFLILTFIIIIPYFIVCLIMNNFSLTSPEEREKFYKLSDKDKGKVIGDELSGWW
ncbi:hypothetical protein [Pseudoalteromonas sp. McH1-42]|uniref:hypothetical protein n=1 Tax=Pseudoalteromonas sp. McH1-42 TaxID=2917752 RepID=UPI001EF466CD|nr:hypothetical protein [Pseudoalteromonas sp. McH1-42]MCG7561267.1 hypothetical protein [Pseudoalteromonas sp. McH1-42]